MDGQTTVNRQHFIGGSDAAAVLGVSPWKSRLDLYRQKTQAFDEPDVGDPMRQKVLTRGKRLEPYVLDLLREETGLTVAHVNRRFIDPQHAFLACEIDAEAESGENIEIKTALYGGKEWGEPDTDAVPVQYTAQAMHGLMITGALVCVFGVLIGVDDFRIYQVRRDEEIIAALREKEVAFWQEHVLPRIPPPPSTADDVLKWLTPDEGAAIDATNDGELLGLINRVRELKAANKSQADELERCSDLLRLRLASATAITVHGKPLVTFKNQTANRFDSKAFIAASAENAALYEQFKTTTTSRVLRIK